MRYWGRLTITEVGSIIITMSFNTELATRKLSKLRQVALSKEFYLSKQEG